VSPSRRTMPKLVSNFYINKLLPYFWKILVSGNKNRKENQHTHLVRINSWTQWSRWPCCLKEKQRYGLYQQGRVETHREGGDGLDRGVVMEMVGLWPGFQVK
jgi:hypothetical protein